MSKIDLLFLACNRLEFAQESFHWLMSHTDWSLVRHVTVWDDGSVDGTDVWLEEQLGQIPVSNEFVRSEIGSPVDVMAEWIENCQAPILAKIDNDVVLPEGWLRTAVLTLEAAPELDFLGLEAHNPISHSDEGARSYNEATFVSGLGLYRRNAFAKTRPVSHERWFGFEQWQAKQGPDLKVGWIDPALPIFLLDRLPIEPWRSLSDGYAAQGWHRRWQAYDKTSDLWSWRWAANEDAEPISGEGCAHRLIERPFDVVILSANSENARRCITAILENEPSFDPQQIILVDDGAGRDKSGVLSQVRWVTGKKPFVFARNANIGIAESDRDVVLLNDDALLETPGGLSMLAQANDGASIMSAAVRGVVGNKNQLAGRDGQWSEPSMLCFICVHIPREIISATGPLDEDFVGYGFEDNEYCDRAQRGGYLLRIFGDCVVEHGQSLQSSFRTEANHRSKFEVNKAIYEQKLIALQNHRFLGVMRIKNEAEHIAEVIESLLPLCAHVLVFDDHSDDDTVSICESYGDRVTVVHSPFEGLDEARDKTYLLSKIPQFDPDWVIWIDGDEVLAPEAPDQIRRTAADQRNFATITFEVCYVWDEPNQIRVDGIFGRMTRPSAFRYRSSSAHHLRFRETHGVNLHCGNVPLGVTGPNARPGVRLKHYGYVTEEQRTRKYLWYTTIDPDNASEDNYRHLKGEPTARFAPGDPVFETWKD